MVTEVIKVEGYWCQTQHLKQEKNKTGFILRKKGLPLYVTLFNWICFQISKNGNCMFIVVMLKRFKFFFSVSE